MLRTCVIWKSGCCWTSSRLGWLSELLTELIRSGIFLVVSTEGALRLPMTYEDHPTQSHPIPTYSCEDDLYITNLWSIALDDHWSKTIWRPKLIVWSGAIIHPYMILLGLIYLLFQAWYLHYKIWSGNSACPRLLAELRYLFGLVSDRTFYR